MGVSLHAFYGFFGDWAPLHHYWNFGLLRSIPCGYALYGVRIGQADAMRPCRKYAALHFRMVTDASHSFGMTHPYQIGELARVWVFRRLDARVNLQDGRLFYIDTRSVGNAHR